MAKIQYDGTGLKIILNVSATITGGSAWKIYYEKPSGDTGSWTAIEESSTSISYTTTGTADIDEVGTWQLQAWVTTPGWVLYGEKADLTVESIIA